MASGEPDAERQVLIVDDDLDAAEALKDYLSANGFESVLAHTLGQAEEALSATGAGIVLLDVRLGAEHGLDLIARVRETHPEVRFIVMTAFAGTDVAIESVKHGAFDFLRKPLDRTELMTALERSCELVRARKEREAAVHALERSEANMRMAERAGNFGSWTLDLATGRGLWSDEHYRLFGLTPGQFLPTRDAFLSCVHPDDRPVVMAAFEAMAKAIGPVLVEYRIVRPDGVQRFMHSAAMVERGADGAPTRWFGMVQDITRRKEEELELSRGRARLKQALDIAELGTFEARPNESACLLSPEARAIFGGGASASDRELLERVHPDDRARLLQAMRDALERSGQYRIEFRVVLPGGNVRTVESQGQAMRGALEGSASILGLVRDVTRQRQLEQQLRQAQKMEAVGSLAGGVAHDLNNTLQVVRGYIELELDLARSQQLPTDNLERAQSATDSASLLIRQLLAFARGQVLQTQVFDLNELVAQQVQMLRRLIRQDIHIGYRPAHWPATVQADRSMLEQAIVNLCVNARDAMAGGGDLGIEVTHVQADAAFRQIHAWARQAEYVAVTVRDTGIGMRPEVRQRVFEPFFTTKPVGKGTGLGLSMVYGIVQQHEGMVTVSSEPGAGSTFTLYLPSSEDAPFARHPQPPGAAAGGSETVLVAEDEEAVRKLVTRLLTMRGYRVLSAADGEEALQIFLANRETIDLALLDVMMPKLGGPALYERIIALRPGLPVVFSTGYAAESEERDILARSGVPIVHKPYTPNELFDALRKALDEQR